MNTTAIESAYRFVDNKIIIRIRDRVCESAEELLASPLFNEVLSRYVRFLVRQDAPLLIMFGQAPELIKESDIESLSQTIRLCALVQLDWASKLTADHRFIEHPDLLHEFVEGLYDYWRKFERFLICDSAGDVLDQRPYRTFNSTVETLMNLVRGTYRDVQENLSGKHPRIYRQVSAGAEVAAIALPKEMPGLGNYADNLGDVPVIRQVCLYPPMLINPPMNKRTGSFERVATNPIDIAGVNDTEWLCYPARVGKLLVLIYFHEKFFELGFTMSNLFELADDVVLQQKPDAILLFGTPEHALDHLAELPTVFHDDGDILVGAIPRRDEFGYFGYLKKMVLTLHNIKVIQQGNLPYHGAMVQLCLKGERSANIVIVGDTGAGKSETLEAFRGLAGQQIRELTIIADDMGSFEFGPDGHVMGYGTEIGAFVRLDDLQPGYAFSQLDRSIIMNPNQTNARVVLPVTSLENVIKGVPVDMVLYANNYQAVDADHPVIEPFQNSESALDTFREGTSMSKGTTTSTGLVHTYFVNVFGPIQYPEIHDESAKRFFEAFFEQKILVAQLRTQLGVPGMDRSGPSLAAKALLELLMIK
jgi:hypothetical protein